MAFVIVVKSDVVLEYEPSVPLMKFEMVLFMIAKG